MSSASPTRPTRRAAARRTKILEDSDSDSPKSMAQSQEVEDDFQPAARSSPRRQSRRQTVGVPTTPKASARTRKARNSEAIETSVLFEPEDIMKAEPESPSKRPSPRKRKAASTQPTRASIVPRIPKMENLDDSSQVQASPLADITQESLNDQPTQQLLEDMQKAVQPIAPEAPIELAVRTKSSVAPPQEDPAVPKSRLVISYLVLTNFKSYAGRQEVGPFHASFSSVVGPNGSGKSNVIDSLLFVFGFRASKMRQGKISALIHNSAGFPDLEYCEVEVHFQEVVDLAEGGHVVVPDSTMIVSRKAFRNNSSNYYINGKTSNFTVVTSLLRDRGIDLDHKRFLILQGEVESIAQMKPKAANEHDDGLLEYLEDIIGTSKYKTPIEESAVEVETLNEVCLEKRSRVQHVEKEKNSLEEKKDKALAYIRDENELTTKQSALYQKYNAECEDNIKVAEESVTQIQAQLEEEVNKHKGSEDELSRLEKAVKAGNKEFEKLQKDTESILKETARIDKENIKFEEKKKFLSQKEKKLQKAATTSRFAASEASTQLKHHGEDIQKKQREISSLETSLRTEEQELTAIVESLKGKTQELSDQITAKQKSLEPWTEKINEKQSAIAVVKSELEILKEKQNAGAVAQKEMEQRIEKIEEDRLTKMSLIDECKAQKIQNEKDLKKLETELTKMTARETDLRSSLSHARQKAEEARSSLSSTQTQGQVLSGLTRLKESGRIEGFHGRLGNLGTIDQKYDVAISTACPQLDNIVVDTVEVGQQCIDYLRKNSLGRAMFILLDRLPQRDLSQVKTPENVPRLFDLVKPKHDRFKPAFYSVLQNTLVAVDLEQANRIAYGAQRWRVVTLDGQLIDKSGTMTGGGTKVSKGGMSSKLSSDITKDQVAKLEAARDQLENDFEQFQATQRELEVSLKKIKDEAPKLETKMRKIGLELGSFEKKLADAQKRAQELLLEHQPSKSDGTRITALEKSLVSLEREIEKLRVESGGIESEIKDLQDKIMQVGGVRLRGQRAKVDGLKEQIGTLIEEVSAAEIGITKAEKLIKKHETSLKDSEKEIEALQKEMEKLAAEVEEYANSANDIRKHAEEAQALLDDKKEEVAALKTEMAERQAELNESRGVEIEMRNKLEETHKVLVENQKRLRYWAEKSSKLALQPIADLDGQDDLEAEPESIPVYTRDELQDLDKEGLKAEIAILEERTQNANVELGVLSEYRRRVTEHTARSADLEEAVNMRDTAKRRCDDLRNRRLSEFMEGFSLISQRLKEMYQMITMGGNAELELVDSLDPFSEGILFSVMPPKKSWKNISNLSGGEKTLSSLALVFALHHYKPTPLYVMDEIDAALDFRNVSIVASYIKERTKNAQFIVISLRNNMFELASRLVGVYKVNQMTKSITIENKDYLGAQQA